MNYAFGYIRRSSHRQQDNNSLELQTAKIQQFASRKGFVVPEEFIFIEDTTSAFSKRASQRKELMRLKKQMIEANISRVIFYEESRMDRTAYTFILDFYRPLKAHLPHLEVYTTNNEDVWDPESPNVKIAFLMHSEESRIKSDRAIGCLLSHLENEAIQRPGAKVPYGYDQVNKCLVPNERAEIVTFIFFLRSWGISIDRIASILTEAHIPSPTGKAWRSSTIEVILKNPVYTGKIVWEVRRGGQHKTYVREDVHEPLIDSFLLHLIERNVQLQKEYGRLDTPFLFLNKLTCKTCNETLVAKNSSTKRNGTTYVYQYYVCNNCRYKLDVQQTHDLLVPKVLQHIQNLAHNEDLKSSALHYMVEIEDQLEKEIKKLEKRLDILHRNGCTALEHGDKTFKVIADEAVSKGIAQKQQYEQSQMVLADLHEAIQSQLFFERFHHVVASQLGNAEIRLLVLYFIDEVQVSEKDLARLLFKENPLELFSPSLSG